MNKRTQADLRKVFWWDLKYILRDKKALFFMFVLPIALYPLLMWGSSSMETKRAQSGKKKVLSIAADAELDEWITPKDRLKRIDGVLSPTGETDVLAEVTLAKDGQPAEIRYRSDKPRSRKALKRVKRVLKRAQAQQRAEQFKSAGIDLKPKAILKTEVRDASTAADRAGIGLGKLIPLVLVFLAMGGGLHTALDLFTGERERGTLETLLTSRVSRTAVVGAKYLLVLISTILTSILAISSLGLCLHMGWFKMPGAQVSALTAEALVWIGLLAIPLVIQLSSALVLLAASVPNFKAGQFIAMPAMLLSLIPAGVSLIPGMNLTPLLATVPITNVALTTQEVMVSSPRWGLVALAIGISVVHTAAILWVGVRAMGKESAVFGHAGRAASHAKGRYGIEAAGLFVVVLLLFWFIGQIAMTWDLTWGTLLTQILIIALPAILIIKWLGLPLKDRLQLKRPASRDILLAVVAGSLAPCLGDLVFQVQQFFIPISTESLEQMSELLPMDLPLWALIGLIALTPAICEEVLFRGALLGLLRNSLGPVARCIVVAVLFGALHLMLFRIMPTAILGLLLTAAAMRSRSLWIPMLMHLLNNGLVIVAASMGSTGPSELGVGVQVLGAALAIAAVAAMGRGRT